MLLTKLKNSSKASTVEKKIILSYITKVINRKSKFFQHIRDNIDIYWCKEFGKEINGAYSIFYPNRIYLTSSFRKDLKRIAPVALHEFTHCWQYRKFSILYFILLIPFIRSLTIESEALNAQEKLNDKLDIELGRRL